MNRRHIFTILSLAFALSGCAVQRAAIVSPYQKALGAYYKALETQDVADLVAADKEVSTMLAKDPSDYTARILRANVSLTRFRLNPSNENSKQIRRGLLNDLITAAAGVGTVGDAADWVPARALVVMGDYLVLEGDLTAKAVLAGGSVNMSRAAEAKSIFDAARHFYGGAASVVDQSKPNPTPGLVREGANARQGHMIAVRGALTAIDAIDPKLAFPMTTAVRTELVRAWETQATSGGITAASPGVLSFDATQQEGMQALYTTLGNNALRDLATWCENNKAILQKAPKDLNAAEQKTVAEGTGTLRRTVAMGESEALHASLARLLRDSGDTSASISKMLFWLTQDLNQSCKGLSNP